MEKRELLSRGEASKYQPDIKTALGFEQVYQAFSKKMFLICLSKTSDKDAAKDIVQEIFKSLWKRRNTVGIDVNIEHYLMRALKFKIIDHFREKSRALDIQNYSSINRYCEPSVCTEQHMAYIDLKQHLQSLVRTLPPQCQKVFRLSREQGLSNKEIASSLTISERAVCYHIAAALQFLRKRI